MNMPVYAPPPVHRLVFRGQLRPAAADRLPDKLTQWAPLLQKKIANGEVLTGRLIYLRPEMVSSYIFYHFQLQEEKPGALGSKYGLISQHENLLFFYMEKPDVAENESYAGHLKTQNTPPNWGDVMDPHFQPWSDEDGERLWRPIECVFAV
jgi:L-rhamnose mutarotase